MKLKEIKDNTNKSEKRQDYVKPQEKNLQEAETKVECGVGKHRLARDSGGVCGCAGVSMYEWVSLCLDVFLQKRSFELTCRRIVCFGSAHLRKHRRETAASRRSCRWSFSLPWAIPSPSSCRRVGERTSARGQWRNCNTCTHTESNTGSNGSESQRGPETISDSTKRKEKTDPQIEGG